MRPHEYQFVCKVHYHSEPSDVTRDIAIKISAFSADSALAKGFYMIGSENYSLRSTTLFMLQEGQEKIPVWVGGFIHG